MDVVPGRSKPAVKTWLADRPATWWAGLEVVAIDGFTGFGTATTEEGPDAVAAIDPIYANVLVVPMWSSFGLVRGVPGAVRSA